MSKDTLAVSLLGGMPVIPATIEGRPVCLGDYDSFAVVDGEGGYSLMPAWSFFNRYMPSRLIFQGAGHG